MRVVWIILWAALGCCGQDWPSYGGDAGGMKYSPLKQINRKNVSGLRVAWTYHTGDVSDGSKYPVRSAFEATPLVVGGVMYVTTSFCRLIALDPETGRELWSFDPKIPKDGYYPLFINRGPAWWTDGKQKRIFFGTLDGRLFAIDAATGRPLETFGDGGSINLRLGVADKFPTSGYGMSSPPAIYKNLVICGSFLNDGTPQGPSGAVRAFDVHTGKQVWRFNTVPQEGEFGNDTWEKDSWRDRGAANLWSIASLDTERGIVFLPLTSPAFDYYGGDRKGANLFGDSLVALDAATGKRLWHFQTVHHNIWDYDLPAQPNLVRVTRNGKAVPAVVQITKTGFAFVFDRATGKPLFDIEERAVPASEVPGEQAYPTQPFPLKPPPFTRQRFSLDELTDVTPESRSFCQKLVEGAVFGSLYTPIGLKNTVLFPGTNGGANWGGASFDPETHTLYVNSMDVGMVFRLMKRPEGSGLRYRSRGGGTPNSRFWDPNLYPCQKPPWGHLTAIDLDRGEFRWRKVLGVIDELIEKGLPPTGTSNLGGSIVTAGGLVFIGATNDSRFRAFDKDIGGELWVTKLPASAHATPMTYEGPKSKKQYVVIAAGGGNKYNKVYSDTLVAFALAEPQASKPPQVTSPEVLADRRIRFRLYAPKASEVLLTGEWMGPRDKPVALAKGNDSVWSATAGPLEPNAYTYGFIVDGVRAPDPASYRTVVAAGRFAQDMVEVKGEPARPWEEQPVPKGTLHQEFFQSNLQQRERTYYVYTPPGYQEHAKTRYPVLVLLPGTPGSEADWINIGLANRIFDNLLADRVMEHMLVLMPRADVLLQAGTRTDNLLQFEPFLLTEVLPHFESRYRTRQQPQARAIAGYSLGGELALTVGLRHPELFRAVGSFGGSVFEKDFDQRFGSVLARPEETARTFRTIWIGCGAGDLLLPGNRKFSELLKAKDVPHTLREVAGHHSTPAFRLLLVDFLKELFT